MTGGKRPYRIRLWGEVDIVPGLGALSVRARAILAKLATEPDAALTRRNVAALLWPERLDAQALGNLRQLLHEHSWLVQGDTPLLLVSRDRLAFAGVALATDDQELHAAAAQPAALAVALAQTDHRFLAGLDGLSDEFDEWLQVRRHRAFERLGAAVRAAAGKALTSGDCSSVARLADEWARFDAGDEAMARLGFGADRDAAAVRRRMATLSARLANDLDISPSEDTRRAEAAALARIALRQDDVQEPAAVAPVVTPTESPDPRRSIMRWLSGLALAVPLLAGVAVFGWWHAVPREPAAGPATVQRRQDAEALVLAARQMVTTRTRAGYARAAGLTREAIAADPDFAPAWAELGIAIWMPAWWAEQDEPGAQDRLRREALTYLDRALKLEPNLPRALGAMTLLTAGEPQRRFAARAVASDPADADVWMWTAQVRDENNDLTGGLAARARALAIAPTRERIVRSYVEAASALGREDLANAAIVRFATTATDQFSVRHLTTRLQFANGQLSKAAVGELWLLENGPPDSAFSIINLAWMARAIGDVAGVQALTAPHPGLATAYAAVFAPGDVEARLRRSRVPYADNVFADQESRSLIQQGKPGVLVALLHQPAGGSGNIDKCCGDLGANLVVALRFLGRTGEAAQVLKRLDGDAARFASAGLDNSESNMTRLVLACLHNDPSASRWLNRAVDRGWRGQAEQFAADPAEEPACSAQVADPQFRSARARMRALVDADRSMIAASVRRAIAWLAEKPPITPSADGR